MVNCLTLPKVIYVASILERPDRNYMNDINRLVYNFIWNKIVRIKKKNHDNVMDGGKGMTDKDSYGYKSNVDWTTNHVYPL